MPNYQLLAYESSELNGIITKCNNLSADIENIRKTADTTFQTLLDSYSGEANPIILDALPKVKSHLSMLSECYLVMASFAQSRKEAMENQDAAGAADISSGTGN